MNFARMRTARSNTAGFTRTELLVLLGVGAILSGVLGADLNQAKLKLLQQACAANLKQWGLAINLYAQDYNGRCYYVSGGSEVFDDNSSPYLKYLGGGNASLTMRTIRCCPEVAARMTRNQINGAGIYTYSMPIPKALGGRGGTYVDYDTLGDAFNMFFPLNRVVNQSQYLLMIDSSGHTMHCAQLVSGTSGIPVGDTVRAIDRHGGSVNCLFGDFHVELVSAQTVSNQAALCGSSPPSLWFLLN
jgi:prepilin-type processing-associated H-X9-DG protein